MYKIIIDNKVVFITDSKRAFIEYCIEHHYAHEVMQELLPEQYKLEFKTK